MAAMDPPIAAALPNFRCLVIAPPKKSSRLASSLSVSQELWRPDMEHPLLSHARIAKRWLQASAL
jgi:hypothetical protein